MTEIDKRVLTSPQQRAVADIATERARVLLDDWIVYQQSQKSNGYLNVCLEVMRMFPGINGDQQTKYGEPERGLYKLACERVRQAIET